MSKILLPLGLLLGIAIIGGQARDRGLEDPYSGEFVLASGAERWQEQMDTIPPVKERYGDFLTDKSENPFDLKDPAAVEQTVEYDPETGQYILTETIGDFNFRPPTYMTFEEYLEWRKKQDEREYFNRLAGIDTGEEGVSALDPIAEFDVESSLIDRLFGGTTVDIRPQGNIDLTFGVDFQSVENPILTERQRQQGGFDFDMDIQMNVTGKIGEKLNLSTNYNTNATFDFDNQIKLDYNSDLFSEDEILKKIEAGNVSLPLRGTLIQGAQSLFGLKTELQFGHLRLTAIASQQKSERENIQIEGGAQLQEFEVRADEYDENRHFFLSHYNRSAFEGALINLPQLKTLFSIENLEVWITNNRNEVDNVRDIVALADLGEPERLVNPNAVPQFQDPVYQEICDGEALPDNRANGLYQKLLDNPGIREIDQAVSILQSPQFGLQQARDFEKVSARKLTPQEYTVHPNLGYISLNINVQPDQVIGVSYQYSYNGDNFKVGELSTNSENTSTDSTLNVLFVKMLKSTTQRVDVPTWDLMMKNVYPIGAFQVNQEDFRLDIFYEDPGNGLKRFLPESNLAGRPLLRVFNLDNLNVQGDPTPDGVFDFVPGVTINTRNGRIMFPVLEPFGTDLAEQIDEQQFREKFVYQQLYDQTIFQAREFPEKNRFVIKGSYKSSVSSEISLGAFNIPPGSVRVTAGGQVLREGVDYEIDYNIGRVKILNDAILNSGVPVNVSFEDNTLFGFQSKTMFGLRADYEVDENFNIGATYLQLFERPFTQKVNIGDDPINNRIYGFDINLNREAPWLTRAVDALPLLSTKQPSNISFSAETAILQPGHSRAINQDRRDKEGVVYLDDFEGSNSSFDLRTPANNWQLSSVPQNDEQNNNPLFPESRLVNDLTSGANRARISWYRIDQSARNASDRENPYTSVVPQQEVFPNLQLTPDQLPNIQTLDVTYFPQERGPYNFDPPNGFPGFTSGVSFIGDSMVLRDPETRWGGLMRALTNNDFQSANIEFLEFWMLSPFLDENDPMNPSPFVDEKEGDLYINLGNVSEDILRDSRKFFENGLPGPANPNRRVDTTTWSVVPIGQQITRAFDNDEETRLRQDIGLDGLNDEDERRKFSGYLESVRAANPVAAERIERDPSNDNFRYFRDESFNDSDGVITRYRDFINPEGNSRPNQGTSTITSATNIPDAEDLNRDNTLNETESYFQYRIPLRADPLNPREIDVNRTPFVTDRRESDDGRRVWYRFRIPLNGPNKVSVGGITDFRSIRFIRMYLNGFRRPVTLRFARFELVRNQWRRYTQDLSEDTECDQPVNFDVDAVNIEENSSRQPFNYVLPEGIQREQSLGVFNALQNEQSLALNLEGLCDGEEKAVFKIIDFDFRVYERLKMFVHAEALNRLDIQPGESSVFIRLGSDFQNNYYEYEIPLTMSDSTDLPANSNTSAYKQEVWLPENEFDFPLDLLVNVKRERNEVGAPLGEEFERLLSPDDPLLSHRVKVRGNPNVGFAEIVMIGVRNREGGDVKPMDMEVWLNELRLTGLDERGGVAATARMDMQLADFGNLSVAANYSSIGFGALDQKVAQRSREEIVGYDLAANFELGKLLPDSWGIRLPFYWQFSRTTRSPEFDPYDLDVLLKDKLADADTAEERDSIRSQAQEVTSIRSFNFTNVRKERTGGGQASPKPWDVENFSFNYAYSETEVRDPIIEFDRQQNYSGGFDYTFSRRSNYVEPFKNIEDEKFLKILKEFNFNPLPNSFGFSTLLDRRFEETRYRFTGLAERFSTFYVKNFTWDRDYDLQWDLTRSLKFNFNALNQAVIDEPAEIDLIEDPSVSDPAQVRRDSIWENIKDFGRPKNYRHSFTLNYNLPIRFLPFLDWIQVRAQYQADYSWSAAALNVDSLGNTIQNSQNRQINADLDFESLYDKIPYLQKVQGGGRSSSRVPERSRRTRPGTQQQESQDGESREVSVLEKILIRPLLSIRRARFNYSENFATVIPGFMPVSSMMGMSQGFEAPGWDFVAGWQPRIRELEESAYGTSQDWLAQAADKGWITGNVFLQREVVQEYTQQYDARMTIEPFRDFRIDLDANRNFTENHTQFFKDTTKNNIADFSHSVPKDFGSMTISYSALSTLFQDDLQQIIDLFQTFEANRVVISQRLGEGEHTNPDLAAQGYTDGYGRIQQNVLIPAFLAAYQGEDPQTVGLDVFSTNPRVNWRLTYNGLSRLPLFRDIFQNFSLSHSYESTLTVNQFNTSLDFLRTRNQGRVNELNGNFFPRLEIPEIAIQEGFSPLVSVEATLRNGMAFSANFNKQRRLGMSFVSNQLSETQTKEIVIGFGYLIRDLQLGIFSGSGGRPQRDDEPPQTPQGGRTGGSQLQGNDLDINFDFSLRDDVTFNHLLDQDIIEPTRGNFSLSISPSAEYQINERLSLRMFFDYQRTVPKTSAGFPRTTSAGGFIVRFSLN